MATSERFEQWAVVELMGHVRIAGRLTEEERFGAESRESDEKPGEDWSAHGDEEPAGEDEEVDGDVPVRGPRPAWRHMEDDELEPRPVRREPYQDDLEPEVQSFDPWSDERGDAL